MHLEGNILQDGRARATFLAAARQLAQAAMAFESLGCLPNYLGGCPLFFCSTNEELEAALCEESSAPAASAARLVCLRKEGLTVSQPLRVQEA
eukprot:6175722-Amphidinium_carterae.1